MLCVCCCRVFLGVFVGTRCLVFVIYCVVLFVFLLLVSCDALGVVWVLLVVCYLFVDDRCVLFVDFLVCG